MSVSLFIVHASHLACPFVPPGLMFAPCTSNSAARSEPDPKRLLVACLASFVLRLIGEVGKAKQMAFKFQSNTRRTRPVLSMIRLALQLVQHGMAAFPT